MHIHPPTRLPRFGLNAAAIARVDPAPVDVALVLATDCSGSISNQDLALQFRGYADALTNDALIEATRSGLHGRIALTFVTWSDTRHQNQVVPWTPIDSQATADAFAAALLAAPRPMPGYTSISGAIDYATKLLSACTYPALRKVIDISGDGTNNDGRDVIAARDAAIAEDIVINALPIIRQEPAIADYYAGNVIGGPGAFIKVVRSTASFRRALLDKLVAEIAAIPGRAGSPA